MMIVVLLDYVGLHILLKFKKKSTLKLHIVVIIVCNFNVDFFGLFWSIAPDPIWGGFTAPLHRNHQ